MGNAGKVIIADLIGSYSTKYLTTEQLEIGDNFLWDVQNSPFSFIFPLPYCYNLLCRLNSEDTVLLVCYEIVHFLFLQQLKVKIEVNQK